MLECEYNCELVNCQLRIVKVQARKRKEKTGSTNRRVNQLTNKQMNWLVFLIVNCQL